MLLRHIYYIVGHQWIRKKFKIEHMCTQVEKRI